MKDHSLYHDLSPSFELVTQGTCNHVNNKLYILFRYRQSLVIQWYVLFPLSITFHFPPFLCLSLFRSLTSFPPSQSEEQGSKEAVGQVGRLPLMCLPLCLCCVSLSPSLWTAWLHVCQPPLVCGFISRKYFLNMITDYRVIDRASNVFVFTGFTFLLLLVHKSHESYMFQFDFECLKNNGNSCYYTLYNIHN